MGSLMAGWSTKPSPAEDGLKRSQSSLTKGEVDKFWRTKRMLMQEHLDEATKDAAVSPRPGAAKPIAIVIDEQQQLDQAAAMSLSPMSPMNLMSPNTAWWTRSNSAFLNDPPAIESKQHRYVPQFDVALKGQVVQDESGRSLPK